MFYILIFLKRYSELNVGMIDESFYFIDNLN